MPEKVQVRASGDALRPFILHAYGGVYLDYDVECFRATDAMLQGHSLIFQSAELGGQDITNAVMASAPHHNFWLRLAGFLKDKAHLAPHAATKSGSNILRSTGPRLLRDAFTTFVGANKTVEPAELVGTWAVAGTHIRVYGLMQWYVPCIWNDYPCHARIQNTSQSGHSLIPANLVGHHHCSGTWLKQIKARNRRRTLALVACMLSALTMAVMLAFLVLWTRTGSKQVMQGLFVDAVRWLSAAPVARELKQRQK